LSTNADEMVGVLQRYNIRAANFNDTINMNLGEDVVKIISAIADWMNEENDVSDLEALLGRELPEELQEALPIISPILQALIMQLNASEPEFHKLVDLTILTLLFFRTYLVCRISEENEDQFFDELNDFCQALIDLLGYKLQYEQEKSREQTPQVMMMIKNLLETANSA
jgi:hypothetical protein